MLETLDIVIGFVLVMLVMSMAVTMLTQFIGTGLFNMQGYFLLDGVARLLALLDRGLTRKEARSIAAHILRNPLVGKPRLSGSKNRLAPVIHREELVKLVLDFAVEGDAEKANPEKTEQEGALRTRLRKSLRDNGIEDPAGTLKRIRDAVLELEKTNPELSQDSRTNIAILNFAASDYLSKLNGWFDQTVDRVSAVFTARTRLLTLGISLSLALVVHLDTFDLINRLSIDDELRTTLVTKAIDRVEKGPLRIGSVPPQEAPNERAVVNEVQSLGILSFPQNMDEWTARWSRDGSDPTPPRGAAKYYPLVLHLFGILLSAALLSLGAPFWYEALADLVKLRSLVSKKDDAQRAERQTTQTSTDPAAALPPQYRGGEVGDLAATG